MTTYAEDYTDLVAFINEAEKQGTLGCDRARLALASLRSRSQKLHRQRMDNDPIPLAGLMEDGWPQKDLTAIANRLGGITDSPLSPRPADCTCPMSVRELGNHSVGCPLFGAV